MRDEHAALDIVQDAMLKLTEKYSGKPPAELPLLFQRILQNTINDHFRRSRVRSLWTTLISALSGGSEDDESDPLDTLQTPENSQFEAAPPAQLERVQLVELIEAAMETLPPRQRQAFLLRYWEEMDVAETASVMGCSEGSVKTHCSRASHALAQYLKSKGVEP